MSTGPTLSLDEDALFAALDLVGRTGAEHAEFGYLVEDVPIEDADWYAHVQYVGARIMVEHHRGPLEALEALARKLLTGATCVHCRGLIALSDSGAVFVPGVSVSGVQLVEADARSRPACRWTRVGPKWVAGCQQSKGSMK